MISDHANGPFYSGKSASLSVIWEVEVVTPTDRITGKKSFGRLKPATGSGWERFVAPAGILRALQSETGCRERTATVAFRKLFRIANAVTSDGIATGSGHFAFGPHRLQTGSRRHCLAVVGRPHTADPCQLAVGVE